jgi:hypothetical protein
VLVVLVVLGGGTVPAVAVAGVGGVVVSPAGGTMDVVVDVGVVAEEGGLWECRVTAATTSPAAMTTAPMANRIASVRPRGGSGSGLNSP